MRGGPFRILLVEDDQVDRLACRRTLTRQSGVTFEFIEADTGHEGLQLARSKDPDCVLLDYQLPDLNGLEVLAELNAAGKVPPVIMLTGADNVSVAVEAMRRGARDYLVKDSERRYLELLPAVIGHALAEQRTREEKREAETDLRAERDFIAAVLSTVGALVVVFDREGRVVRFNRACEEATGYRFEELSGRTIWDLVLTAEERAAVEQIFADIAAGRFPSEYENYWRHREGSRRLIAWSNTALLDQDGRVEYVIATGLDVTERRAAEEAERRNRDEVDRMYRQHAVGAMASAFAHELNQPLTAIASYSDASLRLLRAGRGEDPALAHNLEQSALQAQRAAQIVRQVRAFLRRGEIETTPEDLNELVRDVLAQIAADAAAAIHIDVSTGDVPPVLIRRIAVERVLLNLLQNALEAAHDAGAPAMIKVRTAVNEAGLAQVTVEDTGPGLDPGTAERIFQPFYTTKAEGLGMGLAISQTLIEAQGGRLWSEPPRVGGATFHFTVPLA